MAKLKYGHWARPIGITGSAMSALGGIAACFYPWPGLAVGVYSIIIGVIFFCILWRFQSLGFLLLAFEMYYVASALMITASIFMMFTVPTILAGMVCVISGTFYLIGAVGGEKGLPLDEMFRPPRGE
eukprot:TRINITY_DN5688_c0_g1_i2.p1 TRINITY_DN5688_c0_g1~~TRINITY_DN5688_c0_g1_i2.p1  ORF type:complete len:127 (+),score=19.37 TRINITY_DN5688_c0_g1_i2:62-442(+)